MLRGPFLQLLELHLLLCSRERQDPAALEFIAAALEEPREVQLPGNQGARVVLPGQASAPPPPPPPPPPRTNRTRRVPHPVLIRHAASLTPY